MRARGRSAVVVSVLFGCGTIWACSLQSPSEDELFPSSSAGTSGNAGTSGGGGNAGTGGSGGENPDGGGGSSGSGSDAGGDADNPDAPFNPQDGLILHYRFDQTTGTEIVDSSGNSKVGQLINVPADPSPFVIGRINSALKLMGTNDTGTTSSNEQYVELPDNVMNNLSEVTVATWFRWEGSSYHERLWDFGGGPGNWFYFSHAFDPGFSRVGIRNPRTNKWIDLVGTGAQIGEWTHVAVTWNAQKVTIYLNGVADASVEPLASTDGANKDTEPTLPSTLGLTGQNWIGKSQFQGQSGIGDDPPFNGLVDEFRVYSRALSAGEVAKLKALTE